MKKCLTLFVFLVLFVSEFHAQDPRWFSSCPIDSSSEFELTLRVYHNLSANRVEESLYLNRILRPPFPEAADSCLNPYQVSYDLQKEKFRITTFVQDSFYVTEQSNYVSCGHDSLVQYLDLDRVKFFQIHLFNSYYSDSITLRPLDLSKLKCLDHLNLAQLEKFELKSYVTQNTPLYVRLSEWPHFESLKNSTTSKAVSFYVPCFKNERILEDLQQIKGIAKIEGCRLICSSNGKHSFFKPITLEDHLHFPDLQIFPLYDDHFHPEICQLKKIMGFETKLDYWPFNSAEKHFYKTHLPGDGNFYVNYIDTLLFSKHPEFNQQTGKVLILAQDLFVFDWPDDLYDQGDYPASPGFYFNALYPTDTIAYGHLENGKQTGEWRYYGHRNSETSYHTCFHEPIRTESFPRNGSWNYSYSNGTPAITGQFKNGMKTGTWRFYDQAGQLEELETYKKNQLRGLVLSKLPEKGHFRAYYGRKKQVTVMTENSQPGRYAFYCSKNGMETLSTDTHSVFRKVKRDFTYEFIQPGTKKYERLTRKMIRKVYPGGR